MKRFEVKENAFGGKGKIEFEHLLSKTEMDGMLRVYAKVTIPEGASLGYHVHQGDSESYYILSGTGKYTSGKGDLITESEVFPGDVTFTPEGEGHSIENTGKEALVFMALIINSQKKEA